MVAFKSYLFGIRTYENNGNAEIHLVPTEYWNEKHTKYPGYIPDSALADTFEEHGYIECMENIFEFNINKISMDETLEFIKTLGNIEHSAEFEHFVNLS